jgi:putative addiction module CopG family antidote
MNVSLSPWDKWIEAKIKSGRFNNASELLRHCCRVVSTLEQNAGPPGISFDSRAELEKLLAAGLDSGPALPMTSERRKALQRVLRGE